VDLGHRLIERLSQHLIEHLIEHLTRLGSAPKGPQAGSKR
jgi:hypothetical protein